MYLEFDGYMINRDKNSIDITKLNSNNSIFEETIIFDEEYIHKE
jgi:hypothetical protein